MKKLPKTLLAFLLIIAMLIPAASADTLEDLLVPSYGAAALNDVMTAIIDAQNYDADTTAFLKENMLFCMIDIVDNVIYYDSPEGIVESSFYFQYGGTDENGVATSLGISANYPYDADTQYYMIMIAANALAILIADASDLTSEEIMNWFVAQSGSEFSYLQINDDFAVTYSYNDGHEQLGLIRFYQ